MIRLWLKSVIGWINELGTPAVKLLVAVMFAIIFTLWLLFKDNYGELKKRNRDLEHANIELQKSKDTDHTLMQDKIDQGVQLQIRLIEKANGIVDKAEKIEKKVNKLKIK